MDISPIPEINEDIFREIIQELIERKFAYFREEVIGRVGDLEIDVKHLWKHLEGFPQPNWEEEYGFD